MDPTLALFSDVGGGEIVVIGVIALLLFGKNLPAVSRSVGVALAQFKKGISDATSEIKTEMDAAADEVNRTTADVSTSIKVGLEDVERQPSAPPALPAVPAAQGKPEPEQKQPDSAQSLDRPDTTTRPLIRPAPGTVASGAISPAAALDKVDIPAPSNIPPPVE